MEKIKLPADASKLMSIRLDKYEFDFVKSQYNSDPILYRSYSGVIKEGLKLLQMKRPAKAMLQGGSLYAN